MTPEREITCAFTGHRILRADEGALRHVLADKLSELAARGYRRFLCGGAAGFDLLAGETALSLRHGCPGVRLVMVLPCEGQETRYAEADGARYRRLLEACDERVCLAPRYARGCMLARDRYLVDNASFVAAYLTQPRGGTRYTVRYAEKKGVPVWNAACALQIEELDRVDRRVEDAQLKMFDEDGELG